MVLSILLPEMSVSSVKLLNKELMVVSVNTAAIITMATMISLLILMCLTLALPIGTLLLPLLDGEDLAIIMLLLPLL